MGAKVGRRGRRNRGIKRIRWLLGITGVLPIALVTTPSPAQAAYGNMCDYAVVIGVRGTDAAPGKGSLHSGRLYSDGGFGTEIQPLINQLRRDVFPYYYHALNYPAAGGTGYIDSVNKGRSRLIAELNYVANSCGKIKPAVVLAGHSQGAAVVLAALIDDGTSSGNLTSKARAMIRAVAVYGDPLFKKSQAMNAPGAQDQKDGLLGARPSDGLHSSISFDMWVGPWAARRRGGFRSFGHTATQVTCSAPLALDRKPSTSTIPTVSRRPTRSGNGLTTC
jgi:pimeloyl-ACP methyl ester carboxylesterase